MRTKYEEKMNTNNKTYKYWENWINEYTTITKRKKKVGEFTAQLEIVKIVDPISNHVRQDVHVKCPACEGWFKWLNGFKQHLLYNTRHSDENHAKMLLYLSPKYKQDIGKWTKEHVKSIDMLQRLNTTLGD